MAKGIFTAIGTLLIVVLILYLAYVFTKQIGKGVGVRNRSANMKVVDQIVLGRDRTAAVVKIGKHLFLIGVTASQISLLSELEDDDIVLPPDTGKQDALQPDFKEILEKFKNRKKRNGQ